ncbi:hypothetical protein L1049_025348 [Liquidambar formosana]|uniref:Uncharacterized protein n=1 Tax=Liquidambar formosana TaxID=63359 RepID=A0AAP0N6N1_LIQFO
MRCFTLSAFKSVSCHRPQLEAAQRRLKSCCSRSRCCPSDWCDSEGSCVLGWEAYDSFVYFSLHGPEPKLVVNYL